MMPENEWINHNWNQIDPSRQTKFCVKKTITTGYELLNNKIPLLWFNKKLHHLKSNAKKILN
jgi:hypothetical protein